MKVWERTHNNNVFDDYHLLAFGIKSRLYTIYQRLLTVGGCTVLHRVFNPGEAYCAGEWHAAIPRCL